MNDETAWAVYETHLRKVSTYIDEGLDIDRLAEIACMSSYHWHRICCVSYEKTFAATVKRLRLHRAVSNIFDTDLPVSEITKRSGYPDASRSTVSLRPYGMSPARYRNVGAIDKLRSYTCVKTHEDIAAQFPME